MHRSTGNCKKERKKEKKKGKTHRREEAAKEAKSRSRRRRRRRLGLHCRLLVVIKCAEKKGEEEKGRGNGCWKGGNERVWGWQRDGIFAAANHFSASQQQFSSFIFIHFKKQ